MKHILILLALVFSMASTEAQPNSADSPEQDYQAGLQHYLEGNYKQAFNEFQKAANQGHAEAQFNLGVMYEYRVGVDRDYTQAFNWHKKAAEQGHAEAQFQVGWMYDFGQGVDRDYTQAIFWLKQSALQGQAEAQRMLGVMYEFGKGVDENNILAYMWYGVAAVNGNSPARDSRARLTKLMGTLEIKAGQDSTTKCLETNYQNCDLQIPDRK